MLDDILNFAVDTLVDNGRLSFWMPTANDEELEIPVPTHPCLEIVVVCVQPFNKCKSLPEDGCSFITQVDTIQGQGDSSLTGGCPTQKSHSLLSKPSQADRSLRSMEHQQMNSTHFDVDISKSSRLTNKPQVQESSRSAPIRHFPCSAFICDRLLDIPSLVNPLKKNTCVGTSRRHNKTGSCPTRYPSMCCCISIWIFPTQPSQDEGRNKQCALGNTAFGMCQVPKYVCSTKFGCGKTAPVRDML